MPKIEPVLKSEIQRLAKREIRSTFIPLRREVRAIRLKLSTLAKGITSMTRITKELRLEETGPKLDATPAEVEASRLTPERIRGLRRKLGISMRELGILTGATIGAVLSWEKGKFKPRGEKKDVLVGLRKARKREVRKLLAKKEELKVQSKTKKPRPKIRKKTQSKKMIRRRK